MYIHGSYVLVDLWFGFVCLWTTGQNLNGERAIALVNLYNERDDLKETIEELRFQIKSAETVVKNVEIKLAHTERDLKSVKTQHGYEINGLTVAKDNTLKRYRELEAKHLTLKGEYNKLVD